MCVSEGLSSQGKHRRKREGLQYLANTLRSIRVEQDIVLPGDA